MTTRGRKPRPGRIMFVGSGPGDPALLTTRAASVLANAPLVFIDPDVPEPVLALIGKDLPPVSGPAPAEPAATVGGGSHRGDSGDWHRRTIRRGDGGTRHPARVGRPGRGGQDTGHRSPHRGRRGAPGVRRPAVGGLGDHRGEHRGPQPPALRDRAWPVRQRRGADLRRAAARLVAHRCRRARPRCGLGRFGRRPGPADPAGHVLARGRRGPHADRVRPGRHHSMRGDLVGDHLRAAFGGVDAGRADRFEPARQRRRRRAVAGGRHHRQDGGQPGQAELVGESRPVRLDRAGAADQGPGRRDERAADRARRTADRGADHRRRAAAQPRADGTRGQGSGRRPLPVGGVHLDQRGARGVGEVRRVRSRRPRVLRREDRLRRRIDRRPGACVRDQPRAGALR